MDDQFRKLHRRAAKGEPLTVAEHHALDTWYAEQDRAEAKQLAASNRVPSLSVLQEQVAAAVQQLAQVSQQVQDAVVANENLRHDIAALQEQLTHQTNRRAA